MSIPYQLVSKATIISMIGQWRAHWEDAREMVFDYTKEIVKSHLQKGHDVLLPYLLINPDHSEILEKIAQKTSADFYEVYIDIERKEAIERLLVRGVWGEDGSPKVTDDDMPEIDELYDAMEKAMKKRKNVTSISSDIGDIDGTYEKFLKVIE